VLVDAFRSGVSVESILIDKSIERSLSGPGRLRFLAKFAYRKDSIMSKADIYVTDGCLPDNLGQPAAFGLGYNLAELHGVAAFRETFERRFRFPSSPVA